MELNMQTPMPFRRTEITGNRTDGFLQHQAATNDRVIIQFSFRPYSAYQGRPGISFLHLAGVEASSPKSRIGASGKEPEAETAGG